MVPSRCAFDETISLAQKSSNEIQEVFGHNNSACHTLLVGDLKAVHEHVEKHGRRLPLQYLYSTRGEIAIAERRWIKAEEWFSGYSDRFSAASRSSSMTAWAGPGKAAISSLKRPAASR